MVAALYCSHIGSIVRAGALMALAAGIIGCRSEALDPGGAAENDGKRGAASSRVAIAAGTMQSGFSSGPLRFERRLAAFDIGRHPVTWSDYEACVQSRACAPPDASACGPDAYAPYPRYATPAYERKSERAPATCVGESQAQAYCSWVGGRLPRLDEWLLAARGSAPRRFAWGDQPSRCDQHVLAPRLLELHADPAALPAGDREAAAALLPGSAPPAANEPPAKGPLFEMATRRPASQPSAPERCEPVAFDGSELNVGQHPSGASPSGVEDVLSVPGELVAGDAGSIFNACGDPAKRCVVFGLDPGAIDSVEPFMTAPAASGEPGATRQIIAHAYGFRCAFDVEGAR